MLARVANSLYWTGRYIERSENLARYLKVQYFSSLDAPMIQQKDIVLKSILHMSSDDRKIFQKQANEFQEQEVLVEVAFNNKNHHSIFSNVQAARENARSVRYVISTELWEAINRYYHFIRGYSIDFYKTRGLYDFTTTAIQNCSVITSYVDSTLLHDDIWAFIKLGIYIERTAQIVRILNNKMLDIQALADKGKKDPLIVYQWTTTLKALETFDMYRRIYKGDVQQKNVISFLLTNEKLPRSVVSTLERVNYYIAGLTFAPSIESKLEFQASKLAYKFKFLEYDEIENNLQEFLVGSLHKIYALNNLIEQEYFE